MSDKLLIKDKFSRAAPTYEKHAQIQKIASLILLSHIKQYHHGLNSKKLLDLGCGSGFLSRNILSKESHLQGCISCDKIVAFDISNSMLQQSFYDPDKMTLKQGDMDDMPFEKHSFDGVISSFAMHWSSNFSLLLKNLFSLITKGGFLAFIVPNSNSMNLLKEISQSSGCNFAFNDFLSHKELKNSLKFVGFDIINDFEIAESQNFQDPVMALKNIKKIGANHTNNRAKFVSKNSLKKFRKYQDSNNQKSFTLTWNLSCFICFKK